MLKKIAVLICLLMMSSCGQDYNSNYNDQGQYTSVEIDTSTPAGTRLAAAYKVLQVKCMGCHDWVNFNTSEKWIQSGYVTQGNYAGSVIIGRLKNYGGDMPKDPAAALPASEISTLQEWITNL